MIEQCSAQGQKGIVRLEDAYKIYQMGMQEVRALAGVTISFERGSFWAIMGPSGSGKSTMMNILGCLDRLSSGQYYLEGQDVSMLEDDSLSELRLRHLGFIFQSFNLIPQLTVQKNIELPLYYLGWDSARSTERAKEIAEEVGLGDRLGHRSQSPGHWRTTRRFFLRMNLPAIWIRRQVNKSWNSWSS